MASPYKPFTIADRVIIRQLWTYNDGIVRSRIRELTDNNGTVAYSACTKYKFNKDNQPECEQPILPTEFAQIRSLYSESPLDEKVRLYFLTKENPNVYFVADLPTSSDEVVIEIECPKDVKPVIPKWLSENAIK